MPTSIEHQKRMLKHLEGKMHLGNRPPIFVPEQFRSEVEKFTKAALMDMVWDYAHRCAMSDLTDDIMAELRKTGEIIKTHRKQAA